MCGPRPPPSIPVIQAQHCLSGLYCVAGFFQQLHAHAVDVHRLAFVLPPAAQHQHGAAHAQGVDTAHKAAAVLPECPLCRGPHQTFGYRLRMWTAPLPKGPEFGKRGAVLQGGAGAGLGLLLSRPFALRCQSFHGHRHAQFGQVVSP